MPEEFILRCSDDHYYTARMQTIRWRSAHFGLTQFRPCGVDRRWRLAKFVNRGDLTSEQLEQAAAHRV